jgi:nucleoid DNA-binding protein
MTKAEFVEKLAKKGETTKKHAAEAIDLIFGTIAEQLTKGAGLCGIRSSLW